MSFDGDRVMTMTRCRWSEDGCVTRMTLWCEFNCMIYIGEKGCWPSNDALMILT